MLQGFMAEASFARPGIVARRLLRSDHLWISRHSEYRGLVLPLLLLYSCVFVFILPAPLCVCK